MRVLAPTLALAASLAAADLQAFDADDTETLREGFRDGLAGAPVDLAALDSLIDRAAKSGIVPLDFYDGKLEPLDGPVLLEIPVESRFVCTTDIETDPELSQPGALIDSEERVSITKIGDGGHHVSVETVDAEATVGLAMDVKGEAVALKEFYYTEGAVTQHFVMRADGSMVDESSSETIASDSADVRGITQMAELVAATNPFWFADDATLTPGEGYLEDALLGGLMDGFGSVIGLTNDDDVAIDLQFFRFVLTGRTVLDGRESLVFQGVLFAQIDSRRLGALPIKAAIVQAFDGETGVQSLLTSHIEFGRGPSAIKVVQSQKCRVAEG